MLVYFFFQCQLYLKFTESIKPVDNSLQNHTTNFKKKLQMVPIKNDKFSSKVWEIKITKL